MPKWWLWAVFAGFALSFCTWVFASPLMSSPDEPAHIIRAASVWHGQWGGPKVLLPPDPAAPGLDIYATEVEVPRYYARSGEIPGCWAGQPSIGADCAPEVEADDDLVDSVTTAGVYTPLYYSLVGWPSQLTASGLGVYLMRITSALLCAGLVTLAVAALGRILDPKLALLAVWVAATPMVHFLAGSVNPNGLETCAAIAAWAAVLALLTKAASGELDRFALWSFVGAAVVLVPSRTLSPAYLLVAVVAAAAFSGLDAVRFLVRQKMVWVGAAVVGVVALLTLLWARAADQVGSISGGYAPDNENIIIWLSAGIDDWVRQMISVFGWLDTGPVVITLALWLAVVVALVVFGAMWGRPWRVAGLACLVFGSLVLPVVIQAPVAAEHGIAWQGRYLLPVAVGIPLMAMLTADDPGLASRLPLRRLGGLVLVSTGAALVVAHIVSMQRYVTGILEGPAQIQNYIGADGWNPPIPKLLLLLVALAAALWPIAVLFAARREAPKASVEAANEA
ncbi:MAG: DUF2142 domain-containing protein [Actinomycetia bacterium]|nr:DUF2142 domain-containing protein [Actinomycetes bacterium]